MRDVLLKFGDAVDRDHRAVNHAEVHAAAQDGVRTPLRVTVR
jgi:hypothetical protein